MLISGAFWMKSSGDCRVAACSSGLTIEASRWSFDPSRCDERVLGLSDVTYPSHRSSYLLGWAPAQVVFLSTTTQ